MKARRDIVSQQMNKRRKNNYLVVDPEMDKAQEEQKKTVILERFKEKRAVQEMNRVKRSQLSQIRCLQRQIVQNKNRMIRYNHNGGKLRDTQSSERVEDIKIESNVSSVQSSRQQEI